MQATNGILWYFFPCIITGTFIISNERVCVTIGKKFVVFSIKEAACLSLPVFSLRNTKYTQKNCADSKVNKKF